MADRRPVDWRQRWALVVAVVLLTVAVFLMVSARPA